jgi:protein O-mannosyl-transferase
MISRHPTSKFWPFALIALVFAVFSPLLYSGQFFWDDYVLLVDNPLLGSSRGLYNLWFSTRTPDYFPLTSTSFWLEWPIWGMHAQGYHLTNILLHAASSLLLWRIFLRLHIPGALLIAALFAVHPVNVESVAWIAERKNTLSMFFASMSLLLYLRSTSRQSPAEYLASIACFLFALLAKTAVVMFPFLLLLLIWWKRRRITTHDILRTAPFFLLSLLLGLITIFFQYTRSISDIIVRDDPLSSRLAIAGHAVWFYIAKVLCPIDITFNYPRWPIPAHGPLAFLPLVLLLSLFLLLWRIRPAFTALAAYTLLLLPMLGLLNIFFMRYSLVSDHWQYHATPILLALIVATLLHLTRRLPRRLITTAGIAVVLLLAADSFTIARIYQSPESIWTDTLLHNPTAWLADAQLGELDLTRARQNRAWFPAAIDHLRAVTLLQPDQSVGYTNLANAYVLAKRFDDALAAYTQALNAKSAGTDERSLLHYNLGALYAQQHNYPLAESHITEALHLNPNRAPLYLPALLTLAKIELDAQHPTRAAALLNDVLSIDPTNASALAMRNSPTTSPASRPER